MQMLEVRRLLASTPFSGTPMAIPGSIEAEHYDLGGEGVAYHDTTSGNQRGAFRSDDVDIANSTDSGGGYMIANSRASEWLKYTVNVATTGTYVFTLRASSDVSGSKYHLEADGVNLTGSITVPDTGSWSNWRNITKNINLTAGVHVLKLSLDSAPNTSHANLNRMSFALIPTPAAPSGLAAHVQSSSSVRLNWTDNATNETGYQVQRARNASFTTGLATFNYSANTTSANLGGLSTGVMYYFRVRAVNNSVYSGYANTVSLGIPSSSGAPAKPSNLTALLQSATSVRLNWIDLSSNENGFQVQRATNSSFTSELVTTSLGKNINAHTVTGLNYGTTYYFRVRATAWGPDSPYSNTASITIPVPPSTPYTGTRIALPGMIEAEHFDLGGEGVAYHDNEWLNFGFAFRHLEGVDIESISDTGGGYGIGWVRSGEWLKYSVDVAATGTYELNLRVASDVSGGMFHVESDGINITGSMSMPNTGGWSTWTTLTQEVALTAGNHLIRLVMDSAPNTWVGNFNWISVTEPIVPTPPPAPSNLTGSILEGDVVRLSWVDNSSADHSETGFEVQRATDSAFTADVVTTSLPQNATTLDVTGLSAGSTYYFRVRALGAELNSDYSNTATVPIPAGETARNLLFFGNSFTAINDLPNSIRAIVAGDGHVQPYIVAETGDSRSLSDQIVEATDNPQNNIENLPEGQVWSNVIIQEFSIGATKLGDPAQFKADTKTLYNMVKAGSPSVTPTLYGTWAYLGTDTNVYGTESYQYENPAAMQADIRLNYNTAASEINALYPSANAAVAHVGDYWEQLDFAADLYGGYDTKHPGARGSLIAALTLYKTIYSENVSDIEWADVQAYYQVRSITEADWNQLTDLVDGVVTAARSPVPTGSDPSDDDEQDGSTTGQDVLGI